MISMSKLLFPEACSYGDVDDFSNGSKMGKKCNIIFCFKMF